MAHCPDCRYFVGCEKANWVRGCEEFETKGIEIDEEKALTPEDVRKMTPEEVRANYAKIIRDMAKWH